MIRIIISKINYIMKISGDTYIQVFYIISALLLFNNSIQCQTSSYQLYPYTYDSLPDIASPYTINDSTETVLVLTKDNKYGIVPVTMENGKPLLYSYKIDISQRIILSIYNYSSNEWIGIEASIHTEFFSGIYSISATVLRDFYNSNLEILVKIEGINSTEDFQLFLDYVYQAIGQPFNHYEHNRFSGVNNSKSEYE